MLRDIIQIDEAKCTGCGLCLADCAESALAIVDGKAKLVKDAQCDGLGACLGACPTGALRIIQREAAPFDETLVPHCPGTTVRTPDRTPLCPKTPEGAKTAPKSLVSGFPALRQWPIQLRLVPASAPFLAGNHLVLAADCAGFAMPDLSQKLNGAALLIACPKLDDPEVALRKLTEIMQTAQPASCTIVRMSVPCCGGLERLVRAAIQASGHTIPLQVEIVPVP